MLDGVGRREAIGVMATAMLATRAAAQQEASQAAPPQTYRLSIGQWSFHNALLAGTLAPMEFPKYSAEELGFKAVEYVNTFYRGMVARAGFGAELRQRCEDAGVESVLILCDGEGEVAAADIAARTKAVENHRKWVDLAALLGCHAIRVNLNGSGSADEQRASAIDGMRAMAAVGQAAKIRILAENHGGLSSNGEWMASVMRELDQQWCGTMVDFKNFHIDATTNYDFYKGISEMMPFAKGVSAKSHDFDEAGNETGIDYPRAMALVRAADFRGFIEVEYEGERLSELEGTRRTRDLLLRNGCTL